LYFPSNWELINLTSVMELYAKEIAVTSRPRFLMPIKLVLKRRLDLHTFIPPTQGNLNKSVRLEVFTAVTMKNVVFWDRKPSSYLKGDTSRLRHKVQPFNAM
jgi:hypothetical protein